MVSRDSVSLYYDIDDILSGNERIRVQFVFGAVNLGFLSSGENDLKPGDTAEIPLWLAHMYRSRNLVDVKMPHYFHQRPRTNARADPAGTDLRGCSPHYYIVGEKIAPFIRGPSSLEIIPTLREVFSNRFLRLMDVAQNSHQQDESDFTRKLTAEEHRFYDLAYDHAREFARWRSRDLTRVESIAEAKRRRL